MNAAYTSAELITILGVVGTLIASTAAAIVTVISAARTARIGAEVTQVNTAVNHKERGMPTLVQRVADQDTRGQQLAADLAADRGFKNDLLGAIANSLGVDVPRPPATVVTPPLPEPADTSEPES